MCITPASSDLEKEHMDKTSAQIKQVPAQRKQVKTSPYSDKTKS
jgi:hypothetical protein